MEEFVPTDANLQSPSSLLGGAFSSTGGPLRVGLGGLTSTIEDEDGAANGVGDRAREGIRVMVKLLGYDGWIVAASKSSSPTTLLMIGTVVDWDVVASFSLDSKVSTNLGVTTWAFFIMAFLSFSMALLFWLTPSASRPKTSYLHKPKNQVGYVRVIVKRQIQEHSCSALTRLLLALNRFYSDRKSLSWEIIKLRICLKISKLVGPTSMFWFGKLSESLHTQSTPSQKIKKN